MKTSYYHFSQKGLQPIRVLEHNILHVFENTSADFLSELKNSISVNGLKPGVTYHCREEPIFCNNNDLDTQTPFVGSDKSITLHETFLSFLWIYCYTILVIFDETIQKPLINRTYHVGAPFPPVALEALTLFNYGISLLNNFSKWDKDLPNPEEYDDEKSFYIEKANGVFLYALDFILCHELGHIDLGHIDDDIQAAQNNTHITSNQIKNDEYSADKYAIDLLLKGRENPIFKKTIEFGLIAGFSSLIFLSNKLTSESHPDGDERIKIGLESLSLDDTDNLWGIACLSIKLWTNINILSFDLPNETETFRDLFYLTIAMLDRLK